MTEWRAQLERKLTERAWREHQDRQAPPEVIHRRVDGREVVNRRWAFPRSVNNAPQVESWRDAAARLR